jgi:NADH:ubiquinone oxidoreductase subunit 3 (subunit A)
MADWLLAPPVAMLLFLGLGSLAYRFGGRLAPRGHESPGKRQPYACGEDLGPERARLSYQRFFRLALLFVVVHMATLVVATLPNDLSTRMLALVYLGGVGVCLLVLISGEAEA